MLAMTKIELKSMMDELESILAKRSARKDPWPNKHVLDGGPGDLPKEGPDSSSIASLTDRASSPGGVG